MTSVAAGPEIDRDLGEYFGAYPLAAIRESPLNPRTHYDPKALEELAQNLRAQGQITPGLVRFADPPEAIKVDGAVWEVVEIAAGHRRRRALGLAELETMAVIRRRMDDAEFIEVLNCENLQRDNLHPLEEAQGFRTLMERAGYDIPRIAARVGRATTYVYDRMKLLQLIPDAQALFLADRFTLGHAVLLSRLDPSDQARALESRRSGNGRIGGLFVHEQALDPVEPHPDEPFDDLAGGVKPVSVREFQGWIDKHVRFRPDAEDLPNLFPATEQALAAAQEEELKVVKITREHLVSDEAKDPSERTYGNRAWKRADGLVAEPPDYTAKPGSETPATCDHAVMGVVVAGPGRGDAFKVCLAKKKCKTHWAKEMREAARAAKGRSAGQPQAGSSPQPHDNWHIKEEARRREAKRWSAARGEVEKAVVAKLATMDPVALGRVVLDRVRLDFGGPKDAPSGLAGSSVEALFRQLAFLVMGSDLQDDWDPQGSWTRALKPLGIDPRKIVDQVAPKEKPAKAQSAAKSKGVPQNAAPKKAKKKRAGDVARARAKQKGRTGTVVP